MINNNKLNLFYKQAGYNLIQMAIALLILGTVTAPFIALYNLWETNKRITDTTDNINGIKAALQSYKQAYGVYPCPAPLNILRMDSAYGHDVACNSPAFTAIPIGTCGAVGPNSVCIEQSIATRIPPLAPPLNRIVVGAIPFRLLQIEESKTVDGYGSRIVYAVTQSLTNPAVFDEKNGGISIHDAADKPLTNPDGVASFIIIAPGQDKVGAYNIQGILQSACAGPGLDVENCNIGFQTGIESNPNAFYRSAYQSDAPGGSHFDDTVDYFVNILDPLWRRTALNHDNIEDLSGATGNVGVNLALGQPPTQALDIASASAQSDSIRVTGDGTGVGGKVMTGLVGAGLPNGICDITNSALCFNPIVIGGAAGTTLNGTSCNPAVEYMVGIKNGQAVCAPMSALAVMCPPDMPILMGVNPDHTPNCAAPPAPPITCPATTATLSMCGVETVSLPQTAANQTYTANASAPGSCASGTYTCNADGTWANGFTPSGQCAPVTLIGPMACGIGGFGFGGLNYTQTQVITCTGLGVANQNIVTTTDAATICKCIGETRTASADCSTFWGGWKGTATRTETASMPDCTYSFSGWDLSACTCAAGPDGSKQWVPDTPCPAGQTGNPEKEQVLSSCSWTDTGNKRGSCTCDTTPRTITQNPTCPACQSPSSPDTFRIDIDPVTCTAKPQVQIGNGTCVPATLTWHIQSSLGAGLGSLPSQHVFSQDSCTCGDPVNNHCFVSGDTSYAPYKCICQ